MGLPGSRVLVVARRERAQAADSGVARDAEHEGGPDPRGLWSGIGHGGDGRRHAQRADSSALRATRGGFGGAAVGAAGPVAAGSYAQIGHCLWALLLAIVGGFLAKLLFAIPARRADTPGTETDASARPGWTRFKRPGTLAAAGLALIAALFAVRTRGAPGLWAGATYLATCGVLGLTVLGALLDRGRRGDIWLGAALFGIGYLMLALGRDPVPDPLPHLPTDQFLQAAKAWLPRSAEGFFMSSASAARMNDWILSALERTVPMHFPEDTPIEDVIAHVKQATKSADGRVLPIYFDPIGLQEAERSMTSVVHLDLEGVPLKTTLLLCLKQLGLCYCVRDGVLVITSEESVSPMYEDPFLVVGHCVFALLAAAVGGALAPLVRDARAGTRRRST